jgi:hypothetical protein
VHDANDSRDSGDDESRDGAKKAQISYEKAQISYEKGPESADLPEWDSLAATVRLVNEQCGDGAPKGLPPLQVRFFEPFGAFLGAFLSLLRLFCGFLRLFCGFLRLF